MIHQLYRARSSQLGAPRASRNRRRLELWVLSQASSSAVRCPPPRSGSSLVCQGIPAPRRPCSSRFVLPSRAHAHAPTVHILHIASVSAQDGSTRFVFMWPWNISFQLLRGCGPSAGQLSVQLSVVCQACQGARTTSQSSKSSHLAEASSLDLHRSAHGGTEAVTPAQKPEENSVRLYSSNHG